MRLNSRKSLYSSGSIAIVFLGGLVSLLSALISDSSGHLTDTYPVGPYLNGIFPAETPGNGSGDGNWTVVNAFPDLLFADPLSIVQIPDTSGFYVTGKQGFVWKISHDTTTALKTTVLDISSVVDTDGDAGLINMVLHPEFGRPGSPNRGYAYFIYRYHPLGNLADNCDSDAYTRLSRFTRPDGQEVFDRSSEFVLVQQHDPHCWHSGGGMFFDDEGYFYFAFGDAGSSNDFFNSTQQIDSFFFGGLHRIDVDRVAARSHPIRRQPKDRPHSLPEKSYTQGYSIPNDNPWVNSDSSTLEEFFALGFRNPHRANFDPTSRQIWVADVGEGAREEINLVEKGDNLQWPFREGSERGPKPKPLSIIGNSKGPVYDYSHAEGNAVIGGFIYRGAKFNGALDGKFIFGDHGTRNIWTYNINTHEVDWIANVPSGGVGDKNGISSFGTDFEGNVYVLKLYGTDLDGGIIYKLQPSEAIPDPPSLLSQTGAFTDLATLTPATGLLPYEVNSPLWSDAALKKRWVAIPNNGDHNLPGEQVVFSETGPWQFPPGTVFIKHFELPLDHRTAEITARVETRFIVIKADGSLYGVTYKWNNQGTDAELLTTSDTLSYSVIQEDLSIRKQVWDFPSRTDCQTCHNSNAGGILGLRTWQLNGNYTYPSMVTDNQLKAWRELGIFSNPFSESTFTSFPKSAAVQDESVDLETRVRSYLDANCAHCHRPNGVNGAFDARFSTPLKDQHLILTPGVSVNTHPGEVMVKPKNHLLSELWLRDNLLGNRAMPPLAKNLIDTAYMNVLTQWINDLQDSTCSIFYLSDLAPAVNPINGWGPLERDQSNGSTELNDGKMMSINGVRYRKGLGVHAESELLFDLDSQYTFFQTSMGVDDSTACDQATVEFSVFLDNVLAYRSPVMHQGDDAISIELNVVHVRQLKLVVTDSGDGITCDHANWAEARLVKSCDDGDPCTENDTFGKDCICAGTFFDRNNDGVCDTFNFQIAAKIYLEGPYIAPNPVEQQLMRDDLRLEGLIPLQSPYTDALQCSDSVFQVAGPDAIVDWVWLELRDPGDSTQVLFGVSALLQRDGDVVTIDGRSPVPFTTGRGNYFMVIKHRNHLGIMTKTTIHLGTTNPTELNFTNGSLPTYGTNAQKMIDGRWALLAGDADGNGIIDETDQNEAWEHRIDQTYYLTDCSLNGATEAVDRGIIWNNRNRKSQIPQ